MSIQIKSLACPQCGAGQCAKVDGTPNLYACKNCGAEFVLSDNNAPKEMRVIHSMDAGQFDSLKNLKYIALAIAGAALLVLVLPMIWSAIARFKPAQPDLGRLQASTVYEAPAGQFNVVRVMEKDDGRNDLFQILVNSLDSGKKQGEPQQLSYLRTTLSQDPQLAHFSDGRVYLIMNAQKLLRLDPASAQFVSIDTELINRHTPQLGTGISKIELAGDDKPDAFIVTNNSGERYYVFWLSRQILPLAALFLDFHKRPFASYTETQKHFDFAELTGASISTANAGSPSLLVSYAQKIRKGEYQKLPALSLIASGEDTVKALPEDYLPLGSGWVVGKKTLQESGVTQLTLVSPVESRYRGKVLAQNAQRVLIVFNTTPVTDQGRVLQLLDLTTGQPVWSRKLEQLPQITRGGSYLSADALASGFYLRSDAMTPTLLLSNAGEVLHDFSPKRD